MVTISLLSFRGGNTTKAVKSVLSGRWEPDLPAPRPSPNPKGFGTHIQFERAGHHDDGLRALSALVHCEFDGFNAVDKQTAAKAHGILDNPVPVAIFADAV
jgi:hypothetical protein